jgi:hypothetical protein
MTKFFSPWKSYFGILRAGLADRARTVAAALRFGNEMMMIKGYQSEWARAILLGLTVASGIQSGKLRSGWSETGVQWQSLLAWYEHITPVKEGS